MKVLIVRDRASAGGGIVNYYNTLNDYFTMEISPVCNADGCKSFNLTVTNKTDKNLELDWNKTFYIRHGQKTGGFMFEGVTYKDRHNARSPDIIPPGDELSARVWPNDLVCYVIGKNGGWQKKPMPMGENGVCLTVKIEDKEVSEELSVSLSKMPVQ